GVDALQVFHDVGVEVHVPQIGDGVTGHFELLDRIAVLPLMFPPTRNEVDYLPGNAAGPARENETGRPTVRSSGPRQCRVISSGAR
ncbi:hypothetical protein, partial [Streptomyces sp. NPDC101166]|uniref:hypothetical protein n=1 Tax=Streptomyces sp. NPDC101166 TaxID=3366120 RepID=UPI00380489D1